MTEHKLTKEEILIVLETARVIKSHVLKLSLKAAEIRQKCVETRRELDEFKRRRNTDFLNS